MKLIHALEILQKTPAPDGERFSVGFVCGFNPLNLQTLLAAHLRLLLPGRKSEIQVGVYGDYWGNLERLKKIDLDAGVVILEWPDLDPRLGIRSLASWAPSSLSDITRNVNATASYFQRAIEQLSEKMPLVVCLPTLPLPPIAFTPGWQASSFEFELRASLYAASARVARISNVRIVNQQRLDRLSPLDLRLDLKSELLSGFPYRLQHGAVLAELVAYLLQGPAPKKGVITDLDDTLWKGIVGEVGVEGVSWDLDQRSHMHGIYQKLLHALSEAGVLVGVASKNERSLVEEAFLRKDLLLPRSAVFPMEIHWGPKSQSVGRILKGWNVGPESVVFVDDSPSELEEVKAAYPEVECILFPKEDPEGISQLLEHLRDAFGKSVLFEEDAIRLDSIRRTHFHKDGESSSTAPELFLEQADAKLLLDFSKEPLDQRALELVNKTNQFNLNGKRHTEVSWQKHLKDRDALFLIASYKDKYGPLGKIAVLTGRRQGRTLLIDTWVMSCRAFGRRIEHRCLEELFLRLDVDEVRFDFTATARNQPLSNFLEEILGTPPTPGCRLLRDRFFEARPKTFHRVEEARHG